MHKVSATCESCATPLDPCNDCIVSLSSPSHHRIANLLLTIQIHNHHNNYNSNNNTTYTFIHFLAGIESHSQPFAAVKTALPFLLQQTTKHTLLPLDPHRQPSLSPACRNERSSPSTTHQILILRRSQDLVRQSKQVPKYKLYD